MSWWSDFFESDTELVDTSQPYVLPKAQRDFTDPAVEYGARQLLGSYFGGEGQPGLISQQIPVPIRQTAGLSPLEIQARNTAGGLGGFAPQLNQAQQYYQQSAMGYNPMMAQSFMNPYMNSVYAATDAGNTKAGRSSEEGCQSKSSPIRCLWRIKRSRSGS